MSTYIRFNGAKDNVLIVQGDARATLGAMTTDQVDGLAFVALQDQQGHDVWINPASVAYIAQQGRPDQ